MARFKPRELRNDASLDEIRRQLNEVQKEIASDLTTLGQKAHVTAVQLGDYAARYSDVVRMAPPVAGARLILPPVNLARQNDRVTVVLVADMGALTAEAVDTTVNGAATLPFLPGVGAIEFTLTPDGWFAWSQSVIAAHSVTLDKLAQVTAPAVLGLPIGATSPGDVVALTGAQVGEIARFATLISDTTSTGTIATYPLTSATTTVEFKNGVGATITIQSCTALEDGQEVVFHVNDNAGTVVTFVYDFGSAAANKRLRTPNNVNLDLHPGDSAKFRYFNSRLRCVATSVAGATDGTDFQALFELKEDFAFISADGFTPTVNIEALVNLGDHEWVLRATTVATLALVSLPGEAGHPGIARLNTAAGVVNAVTSLSGAGLGWLAGSANVGDVIVFGDVTSIKWVARQSSSSDIRMRLALCIASLASTVEFLHDTAVSGSLQLNTTTGGGTAQDLVTLPTVALFHVYELRITPSRVQFFIDGAQVGTDHTTHLPSGVALTPYMEITARATTAQTLDLDLLWLRGAPAR